MGKICDPPPFTGGQSAGVYYWVLFRSKLNTYNYYAQASSGARFVVIGPVRSIEKVAVSVYGWVKVNGGGALNLVSCINEATHAWGGGDAFANLSFKELKRVDGLPDTGGDPPSTNCRCSDDSCRVDCASAPDGFCCIDHSVTDRLLQVLQN